VANRRIIAAVQDLLGAETALASPLRDLLQRPGFRLLFSDERSSQSVGARDALITDLAGTYSPAMVNRLAAVIHGCLGEPMGAIPHAIANASQRSPVPAAAPAVAAYAPATSPPVPAMPLPVVAVQQPNNGLMGGLIALVSLLAGALVVGLAWALMLQRQPQQASTPPPKQPEASEAPRSRPPATEPEPEAQQPEPRARRSNQWEACLEDEARPAPPPRPGDVWWPVVGPEDSLAAARRFCRPDAFTNRAGNVQVASFRDKETAEFFAEELSSDMSHPFIFWVGDPSPR
jgi:hypothetical protein